jgi:nucleoside-diphosphate-sugar epimerase
VTSFGDAHGVFCRAQSAAAEVESQATNHHILRTVVARTSSRLTFAKSPSVRHRSALQTQPRQGNTRPDRVSPCACLMPRAQNHCGVRVMNEDAVNRSVGARYETKDAGHGFVRLNRVGGVHVLLGWAVHGADNNGRALFFGPQGDTRWNQRRLQAELPAFAHHELDIRDRQAVLSLIEALRPSAIVHTAAQPSHDLAAKMPFEDFDTNAAGTMNLLESVRRYARESVFVHMSTNKVYGDVSNELPLTELETRWEYARPEHFGGIDEACRIDRSKHSLFGASKVAADVMVQEYGRYFGMRTCCLRGGCLTGPNHSGVELHGFLSYLIRCNVEGRKYSVYGYKAK